MILNLLGLVTSATGRSFSRPKARGSASDQRFFGSGSVGGDGADTMTYRLVPVLASMIVTVTPLGDRTGGGGGSVDVVAGIAGSRGLRYRDQALFWRCADLPADATGSPPERFSATTAHNTKAPSPPA
jgi:hypothetical protein